MSMNLLWTRHSNSPTTSLSLFSARRAKTTVYLSSRKNRAVFYEDVLAASRRMFTIITRMTGKCFGYPADTARALSLSLFLFLPLSYPPPLSFFLFLSKNCIRPEGKRNLRARTVESRSIREERKIGGPFAER